MNPENLREIEDCLLYILEMGMLVFAFFVVVGFTCLCVYEIISFIRERK